MDKRKAWVIEWAGFVPNVGHVYNKIQDGKVVWQAGVFAPI